MEIAKNSKRNAVVPVARSDQATHFPGVQDFLRSETDRHHSGRIFYIIDVALGVWILADVFSCLLLI